MASPTSCALRIVRLSDDAELRDQILLPGLGEYGFVVTGVATETALCEYLRRETPEAVVLDLSMPDTEGFSVSQAVRAQLPNVGIIIFSDYM